MAFPVLSRQIQVGCWRSQSLLSFYNLMQYCKMSNTRGALIVFEGGDRSGKTTQCKKIVTALNEEGIPAQMWQFPDRKTAIGKVINDYLEKRVELQDEAVHLLFSANRWEAVPKMKELLMAGTTLIVDRYSFSGVAFTAAKPGLDFEWCKKPEIGLPRPDAVIFMKVNQEEAASRAAFGDERYDKIDFQKKVALNYDMLQDADWKIINANKTIEELHVEVKQVVKQIIEEPKMNDMAKLWVGDGRKRRCTDDNENELAHGHVNGDGPKL